MENRRMSDQILIDMSEKIGQIHGTITSMEKHNVEIMKKFERHDDRIDSLEQTKYKAHGFLVAIAGFSGLVGSYASHALGIFR